MQPLILLADDHRMIRKGLKLFIEVNLSITDIYEVATCNELMKELVNRNYTHLLLDIILTDGSTLEIIPNIKRLYPNLNIMIFSMQPTEVYGKAFQKYGINFYLSKTAGDEEMLRMLVPFIRNEGAVSSNSGMQYRGNPFAALSPRELEVLHYLLKGLGTKVIGDTLNLKMGTISTLKIRIFEKTNTGNVIELMELANLYNVSF